MKLHPGHPDSEIAALIAARRGRANAISIEEIARALWPEAWTLGGPQGEAARKNLARHIKGAVARLVNHQDMAIASARVPPCGYFVPVTRQEIDDGARAYVRQAVKMLRRAKKQTGDLYYEKLAGQLSLRL